MTDEELRKRTDEIIECAARQIASAIRETFHVAPCQCLGCQARRAKPEVTSAGIFWRTRDLLFRDRPCNAHPTRVPSDG